jgi:hypothetical protein
MQGGEQILGLSSLSFNLKFTDTSCQIVVINAPKSPYADRSWNRQIRTDVLRRFGRIRRSWRGQGECFYRLDKAMMESPRQKILEASNETGKLAVFFCLGPHRTLYKPCRQIWEIILLNDLTTQLLATATVLEYALQRMKDFGISRSYRSDCFLAGLGLGFLVKHATEF